MRPLKLVGVAAHAAFRRTKAGRFLRGHFAYPELAGHGPKADDVSARTRTQYTVTRWTVSRRVCHFHDQAHSFADCPANCLKIHEVAAGYTAWVVVFRMNCNLSQSYRRVARIPESVGVSRRNLLRGPGSGPGRGVFSASAQRNAMRKAGQGPSRAGARHAAGMLSA